jgi:hypothetical protein
MTNDELKHIEINGHKFDYMIFSDCSEYGEWDWTEFYQGTEIERRRKYWLFGEIIETVVPKLAFKLNFSIEDPDYTKQRVRSAIEKQIELLTRAEEIAKGNII